VLTVAEVSAGQVSISDNDRFDVVRSWRTRPRLPKADETFDPDQIAYVDQHSDPEPVCNSGGHYANWLTRASAVTFLGSTSFTVDPDSAGTLTHAWTFPAAASPNTSVAADPTIDFTGCASGTYWVKHVATDSTNGKTQTQWTCVRLHDPTTDRPVDIISGQLSAGSDSPWTLNVTVPASVPVTTLADGALVLLWLDEYYGTTQASYGGDLATRAQVKFTGYLIRDSIERSADGETLTFDAASPMTILENLPGFGSILTSDSTPTNWLEAKTLDVRRAIIYRLRELTSFNRLHDLTMGAYTYTYDELFIQTDTPLGQCRELADAISAKLICTRTGKLRLIRPVYYLSASDRNSAVTVCTLDDSDAMRLSVTREQRYGYYQLEGRGFTTSGAPIFSRAPGSPSEAPQETVIDRLICADQTELNTFAGWRYARLNTLNDGLPTASAINVDLRGGYDVFDPAYVDEWVKVNNITTKRGTIFANTRCSLEQVTITYDGGRGVNEVSLTLNEETDGVPGVTYVPPVTDLTYTDPDLEVVPDLSAEFTDPLTSPNIAAFNNDGNLYRTANFNYPSAAGGPTWTATSLSGLGMSGTLMMFIVDAYSPKYLGTGTQVNGWIATTTEVRRITDIGGTPALGTAYTYVAPSAFVFMQSGRLTQNHVILTCGLAGTGPRCIYTTDGSTWAEATIDANFGFSAALCAAAVSEKIAGKALVSTYSATAAFGVKGKQSLDYGATWADKSAATLDLNDGIVPSLDMVVPFHNNPSENIVWVTESVLTGITNYRLRRVNGGSSEVRCPTGGAYYGFFGQGQQFSLSVSPTDRSRLLLCGRSDDTNLEEGVWKSTDEGLTWTTLVAPDTAFTTKYVRCAISGDNPEVFYLWGRSGTIGYSNDGGVTIDSRIGNISTIGTMLNICGL
jgi:hypothetical protein